MRDTSYLSLVDAWQEAIHFVCQSAVPEEVGSRKEKSVAPQECQEERDDDDAAKTSTWDDALDLLCRAMVIDEELEEKITWERLVAENRCIAPCGGVFDDDYDDDIALAE